MGCNIQTKVIMFPCKYFKVFFSCSSQNVSYLESLITFFPQIYKPVHGSHQDCSTDDIPQGYRQQVIQ